MAKKAESTRVAQMVTCHYCKRKYFVPTAELDKYTAKLEAEIEALKSRVESAEEIVEKIPQTIWENIVDALYAQEVENG